MLFNKLNEASTPLVISLILGFFVAIFILWILQKAKKNPFINDVYTPKGARYISRSLQLLTFLGYIVFFASLAGLAVFEYLKKPIINTENLHITFYSLLLIIIELIVVFLLRQIILYFIQKWHQTKNLKKKQSRTLSIIFEILIWGGALFIILGSMNLPVKTVLAFPLITFKNNNALTIGNVIAITLILSLTNWILSILEEIFLNIGTRDKDAIPRKRTMFTIFKYLVWVLIIILTMETLGVKISVLIASSAAIFVGIGLGIQDIFKDLISGVFLHFEKNLTQGDIIESKGIVGEVKEMGLRTTKIITRDNIFMMIPNHQFISQPVINWSHATQNTRFNVEVGVAYGSDVKKVEQLLLSCASGHRHIAENPRPFVRFLNFGNSSLDFQLFFWTEKTFIVENIKSDIRFSIYQTFAKNDIQIPFPQQDVYIKEIKNKEPGH